MGTKLKAGIIGHTNKGDYGHSLDSVYNDMDEVEVIAISDCNKNGLIKAGKRNKIEKLYENFNKMLKNENLDLLNICPRDVTNRLDMFKACINTNIRGIFCEKPLASTLDEADKINNICADNNIKLVVAHRRANAYEIKAKELIDDGQIGEIINIKSRGKGDHRAGGEDLFVLGTHMMDSMRYYTNSEVNWVQSSVLQNKKKIKKADIQIGNEGIGLTVGDNISATFMFNNGIIGYFESYPVITNTECHASWFGFEIYGSKGAICVRNSPRGEMFKIKENIWIPQKKDYDWKQINLDHWDNIPLEEITDASNKLIVYDLIKSINDNKIPNTVSSGIDATKALEMIFGVYQSEINQSRVYFPLKDRNNPLNKLN